MESEKDIICKINGTSGSPNITLLTKEAYAIDTKLTFEYKLSKDDIVNLNILPKSIKSSQITDTEIQPKINEMKSKIKEFNTLIEEQCELLMMLNYLVEDTLIFDNLGSISTGTTGAAVSTGAAVPAGTDIVMM